MNGRDRWFRENSWPDWRSWDDRAPEWRRLERSLWDTGISINLAVAASLVIADRTGCELAEAWDRLAFNLERMAQGSWPSPWFDLLAREHEIIFGIPGGHVPRGILRP